MQVIIGKTFNAGRRVEGFLDTQVANVAAFVSASLRAKLDTAVQQLGSASVAQESAAGGVKAATVNLDALRKGLYDNFLVRIARVARSALKTSPDLGILTVTAVAERSAGFIGKASAAADAAEKYQAVFTDHGMAPDFVVQLRAAITAIGDSERAREALAANRSTETAAIKAADKAVRDAIGFIDAALRPLLKKDPALAAGWKTSKLIHQTVVTPLPTASTVVPASTAPAVPANTAPVVPASTTPVAPASTASASQPATPAAA